MLKIQRDLIHTETETLLISAAKGVAENQEFYEADFDIYGSFKEQYSKISDIVKVYNKSIKRMVCTNVMCDKKLKPKSFG